MDDKTSGHRSFTVPNGKDLQKFANKTPVSFTPVEVPANSIYNADLSLAQKNMLEMYDVVSRGLLSYDLANDHQGV